jgi:hypothetical protein
MKTKVFGKKIVNFYEIKPNQKFIQDENGCDKQVFTAKPTITKVQNLDEWVELHSFDGEPRYNKCGTNISWTGGYNYNQINLSEDETVKIEKEIFRADLNELHLHTDKIVEENDYEKEYAEAGYNTLIGEFNTQMIESNDKLKAYCEVHKLNPEETDCIELFNIVFPNQNYVIQDGVMKVQDICTFYCNCSNDTTIGYGLSSLHVDYTSK